MTRVDIELASVKTEITRLNTEFHIRQVESIPKYAANLMRDVFHKISMTSTMIRLTATACMMDEESFIKETRLTSKEYKTIQKCRAVGRSSSSEQL